MDFSHTFAYGFKLLIALNTPVTFLELSYTGTYICDHKLFCDHIMFSYKCTLLPQKSRIHLILYTFDKSLYSTCTDEFVKCISCCESIYRIDVKAFSFFISTNEESISVLFDRLFAKVFNKTSLCVFVKKYVVYINQFPDYRCICRMI